MSSPSLTNFIFKGPEFSAASVRSVDFLNWGSRKMELVLSTFFLKVTYILTFILDQSLSRAF